MDNRATAEKILQTGQTYSREQLAGILQDRLNIDYHRAVEILNEWQRAKILTLNTHGRTEREPYSYAHSYTLSDRTS